MCGLYLDPESNQLKTKQKQKHYATTIREVHTLTAYVMTLKNLALALLDVIRILYLFFTALLK